MFCLNCPHKCTRNTFYELTVCCVSPWYVNRWHRRLIYHWITRAVSDCLIRPLPASVNALLAVPRLRTWRSQGSHSSETWTQYIVQPTQCINQLSSWYGTTFRKKSRKLFRGRDLILMKLKPREQLAGSSTNSPFRVFLSTRGPKIAEALQQSIGVKTLTIWVCVSNLRPLYNF